MIAFISETSASNQRICCIGLCNIRSPCFPIIYISLLLCLHIRSVFPCHALLFANIFLPFECWGLSQPSFSNLFYRSKFLVLSESLTNIVIANGGLKTSESKSNLNSFPPHSSCPQAEGCWRAGRSAPRFPAASEPLFPFMGRSKASSDRHNPIIINHLNSQVIKFGTNQRFSIFQFLDSITIPLRLFFG